MMNPSRHVAPAALLALLLSHGTAADTHVLASGALRVEIATAPDFLEAEFGPRFDRTAVVRSITIDGVELLGPWGLPDEFGLYGNGVLGYDDAAINEPFIKIGIGTLLRDTAGGYHFAHAYPVETRFPVEVEHDGHSLTVRQQATTALPCRYDYAKTFTIGPDNTLTIRYRLANTGETGWSFEHYNHHWFRPQDSMVGPGYRVTTGFELPPIDTKFLLGSHSLALAAPLAPGEAAWYGSDLNAADSARNSFELSVDATKIVRYDGAFAPARFAGYASEHGFSPEVFKRAVLKPGESADWSATYRFMPPGSSTEESDAASSTPPGKR